MPQYYGPFMQVIVTPDVPWRCYVYGLPIRLGNYWFVLYGESGSVTKVEPRCKLPIAVKKLLPQPVPFIPISTGDDMHEDAFRVFQELTPRLQKLVVLA